MNIIKALIDIVKGDLHNWYLDFTQIGDIDGYKP